ncbi:DNA-binding transcriptional regulator, AcrR family [Sinosporangium album]|uniref:DNA-binding transcriptional regulator, AcrR family n=1 Tax=Sinosporangium album TaxID=504805 RepID=A0A1G7R9S1_9ACTN|nr:TetR/AcrR family transcriptional regulator [Sinosporangium album]SDG07556.1 DNA-binding transcriptional regulator, AcrR family [Sinosporangium album]
MEEAQERPRDEPRPRDRDATRRRILDAASRLFSELGYDQVTMRHLAAEAHANVALINRYFGSKRALFTEVIARQARLPEVIAGPPDGLPRRLAEFIADRLTSEQPDSPVMAALTRTGTSPEVHEILSDRLANVILAPLTASLPGSEAHLRATLATTLIMGSGTVSRLLGPHHLSDTPRPAIVAHLTQIFETCLHGKP